MRWSRFPGLFVGTARYRVGRVCPTLLSPLPPARFDTKDGTCFSEFTKKVEDTTPFGPNGERPPPPS